MLIYRGEWQRVDKELSVTVQYNTIRKDDEGLTIDHILGSLYFLLMSRSKQFEVEALEFSINSAYAALEKVKELSKAGETRPRNSIQSNWLLGAAYRARNDLLQAEKHLNEALTQDRAINSVEHEANILLDLARLRYDQKNYEEAKSLAEEALSITERCGYVLQGADVNLFLAQYALEQEQDKVKAKEYAEEALKLATCDGPPYYYKVAYDEAVAMLERLS